ncbi:MAG: PEP-CTERM sorting domain-containing protein [Pseudomonadota bacterium]
MKSRLGALIAGVFSALSVSVAQAAVLEMDYVAEFSGAANPSGSAPWLRAKFEDTGANTVQLTLTSLLSGSGEFVSGFYFNLSPVLSPLVINYLPGSSTGPNTTGVTSASNCCKADGDGFFDLLLSFDTSAGAGRFDNGDVSVFSLTVTGLSVATFNSLSENGPAGKTGFLSAAHVQGIAPTQCNDPSESEVPGQNVCTSGWVYAQVRRPPVEIPEPSALLLSGVALAGFAALRRRRHEG